MLFAGSKLHHNLGNISDTHYKCENGFNLYVNNNWSYGHDYLYDTGSNIPGYNNLNNNFDTAINSMYHFVHVQSHGTADHYSFNNSTYGIQSASNQSNNDPALFLTSSSTLPLTTSLIPMHLTLHVSVNVS